MNIDNVIELADKVGRRVAGEYPGIEAEDIAQEAVVGLLEREDRLSSTDDEYLFTVLMEIGRTYAIKERYDHVVNTSSYVYTPKEVKALLSEAYFEPSFWDVPTAKDDYLSAQVSKQTVVVSLLDIKTAWKRLSYGQKDTLLRKYREGEQLEYKTVDRAIESLTRYMNIGINSSAQDYEGPGSRRAMTNAEAQYVTRNQW